MTQWPRTPDTLIRFIALQLRSRSGSDAVRQLLAELGLHDVLASDDDMQPTSISTRDEAQFIQSAATLCNDLDFGLVAGLGYSDASTINEYVARHSRTLRHALSNALLYNEITAPGTALQFQETGNAAALILEATDTDLLQFPRYFEVVLATALGLMRDFTRTDLRPLQMRFAHHRHPISPEAEQALRCPVVFGAERTELLLPVSCLDLPLWGWDPNLHALLVEQAERMLADIRRPDPTTAERVTAEITHQITETTPTAETVARALGMSERTMARRLQTEQTGFKDILASTRLRLARQYLAETALPVAEIAFALGYSRQSAFASAFRAGTGQTPSDFRRFAAG